MSETVWRLSGDLSMEKSLKLEAANEQLADTYGIFPPTLSYFEQRQTPLWRVELFFAGEVDQNYLKDLLKAADLNDWPYELEALPDQDWVSESQKLLHPVEAGRFYVHGSHDEDKAGDDIINLTVDAGQAFGTGQHETTWGCLKLLDGMEQFKPARILDLGTGSGVLAMGAHRLWKDSNILATDIDPIAVEVTRENLKLNKCDLRRVGDTDAGAGVAALTADGFGDSAFRIEGPFELVIANILAGPLVQLAPDIDRFTTHGGKVMLSGLLVTQEKEVSDAYIAQGMKLAERLENGEWLALLFEKP